MNREPLDQSALEQALASLQGWEHRKDRLARTFKFENFREAVAFIVHISFYAEDLDHHPVIYNVYSQVAIELTTHSAENKVTQLDVMLARSIDQVFSRLS